MRALSIVILICTAILVATCQDTSSKYQPATITAVTPHKTAAEKELDVASYDVSLKVRDKVYVVLYTPPNGMNSVEYAVGTNILVLIGKDTLTFPSKLFGTTEVPILRTETLPASPVLDLSKAPGQYYAMKLENLSETLNLTEQQQMQIKPIAEQESAEVSAVCFTPVVSRKERLNRWVKIVRLSDSKLKPILSQSQWEKLQDLRREQKLELKKVMAQENSANQN